MFTSSISSNPDYLDLDASPRFVDRLAAAARNDGVCRGDGERLRTINAASARLAKRGAA